MSQARATANLNRNAALASVSVALLLIGLKGYAAWATNRSEERRVGKECRL